MEDGTNMKITFIPQRSDKELIIIKNKDTLLINDESFDFSPLKDGEVLPYRSIDNDYITGDIKRINGTVELSIIMPHAYIPNSEIFDPISVLVEKDGIVELPNVN